MTWTRVVVGIDRSPGSRRALRWGVKEAREHGAETYVVMAYGVPAPPSPTVGYDQPPQRGEDERRKDAVGALRETLREALGDETSLQVRSDVVEGSPARALIDASKGADLLVIGSRGHGRYGDHALGSVSQDVAAHAACTVAIVR